ncbi:Nucleolar complex-associated protein 3 [Escovopsis weberi]|uniref:Nucleolar complex-associated protein 3 n=1 Tax=Escovopsis weberi TaxID=150374 RepID=A0A0M8MUP4_ESCWE|nr:Nucleolar complex-associated protein 3 [Escovopsis weberi]
MVNSGSKRRKLDHEGSDDEAPSSTSRRAQKAFFKSAANWDLEQDYAIRRKRDKKKEKKESTKLPIKTADGRLEILKGLDEEGKDLDDAESIESDEEWLEGREDDDGDGDGENDEAEEIEEAPKVPEAQQIREAQEELAKLATQLNENPEEHVGSLKRLAEIGDAKVPAIRVLALLTQMSVYKDIIPGYRIRPATEDGPKEKLSKEVRTLRQFEQALVSGYQNYIKELARCTKAETKPLRGRRGQSLSDVAITCACTLVMSVPHFNFRSDLLKIIVSKLSRRRMARDGAQCLGALETLFRDDEEGRPSLEAVSLLSKMMKARDYEVDESVLNLFLSLRLLSEFSGKASRDAVDKPESGGGSSGSQARKSNKKEFRTKRERKALKEQRSLDKDMAAADAMVSHEERDRMQSETLKLVFATYFRVLKARAPHLMGAVLEGLAKYAHLINQDFFGDLLEALKDLIRRADDELDADVAQDEQRPNRDNDAADTTDADNAADDDEEPEDTVRNLTREALLCTVTAFALLEGQDAHNSRNQLHLDLTFFTTNLYTSLLSLAMHADLETTRLAARARLHNNNNNNNNSNNVNGPAASKINVQTTTVLLIRSLTAVLLPPWNIRSVPPLRLAAFSKQLMSAALQLPEKSCQAVLALLGDVAATHGRKIGALWNTEERKGDGRFNALSDTVEGANPFAATVWEGELLRRHFSPKVREGVKLLEKGLSG